MKPLTKLLKNILNEYGIDPVLEALREIFQHFAEEAITAGQMEDAVIWQERAKKVWTARVIRKK